MRQVIGYICEKCGAQYEFEEVAKECEARHKVPTGVDPNVDYLKGSRYPKTVGVLFGTQCLRYGRLPPGKDDDLYDFED